MAEKKAAVVNALTHLGSTFKELARAHKAAGVAIAEYASEIDKKGEDKSLLAQFPALFGSLEGLGGPETKKRGRKSVAADDEDDDDVDKKRRRGPAKEKKVKDPNAPKRPASAYLEYQNSVRDQYRQQFPDISYAEVLKKIGASWQTMTDAEKLPWQDVTAQKKTIYVDAKAKYEAGQPGDEAPVASGSAAEPKEAKKRGRKSDKPAEAVADIPVEDPKKKKGTTTPAKKAPTPSESGSDDSDSEDSSSSAVSASESEATPPPKKAAKKERATKKATK